ncbi:kinase-like domain-containing protein [Lactarius hatsudake]|nr:kinase-like domain-containing protein [Lactarius hatsudake]
MPQSAPVPNSNERQGGLGTRERGTLVKSELWWRDHFYDLEERGYKLRPRYHPRWKPSWINSKKDFFSVEDGQPTITRAVMDAVRVRDGFPVMLKRLFPDEGPYELEINQLFSSPELANDPHNHCAPLLDLIELQGTDSHKVMVFPLLRPFDCPRFQTFGEFVAFFTQMCEGLQFMHQHNVAHRDCTANNVMLEPSKMYPTGFHPVKRNRNRDFKGKATAYTRTQRPSRYLFIDLGLSRQYPTRDIIDEPLHGGDRTAPEIKSRKWSNPFHTDVYYIGNLVRGEFIRKYHGFRFMEELVDAMTNEDPAKRPSIEEVIERFTVVLESLRSTKLRSALTSKKLPRIFSVIWQARQYFHTIQYTLLRQAAIPNP